MVLRPVFPMSRSLLRLDRNRHRSWSCGHVLDAPRSEAVVTRDPGLPLKGSRTPDGGWDELARRDRLFGLRAAGRASSGRTSCCGDGASQPVATAERPITIVGGSAGGHATLVALARRQTCIAAAAVVNPAVTAESVMVVTDRAHGIVEPVLLVSGEQDHPEFRADLATHCLPRRASTCRRGSSARRGAGSVGGPAVRACRGRGCADH
jgi:hypothetical protein